MQLSVLFYVACQCPFDLGYSQELWKMKILHKYIREHTVEAGFPRLGTVFKTRIQAITTTGNDLRPKAGSDGLWRDYEYKRLGTVSLLAAIDLLTGEAIPLVMDSHKSEDFIDILKELDTRYPEGDIIRIILDNHSVHKSKKTQNYLSTIPEGRFEFVFTPTHGSWLNLIEGFLVK
jgi:hypothetical protein